jgi:hypothetical protein
MHRRDRILPATASPGALAVEVPAFLDRSLTEWYEPAEADVFHSDLRLSKLMRVPHTARLRIAYRGLAAGADA